MSKDQYVLVKASTLKPKAPVGGADKKGVPDDDDAKFTPSSGPPGGAPHVGALLARRGLGTGKQMGTIVTMLGKAATTITGTAATTITTVVSVSAGDMTEFSSFSALFDEVKVLGGELVFLINTKTLQTGGTNAPTLAGVCYDPLNNSALAAVEVLGTHQQHLLVRPPQMINDASDAGRSVPIPHTPSGFHHFKFKCPNGTQRTAAATDSVTGQWADTVATTADWGYLKFFVEAPGTAGQYEIRYLLRLKCAFRCRS